MKEKGKGKRRISIKELAKRVVRAYGMPVAEDYSMVLREFDNMVEIIGLVNDPQADKQEILSEGVKFPKVWITLGTIPANNQVRCYL